MQDFLLSRLTQIDKIKAAWANEKLAALQKAIAPVVGTRRPFYF
jgi:hypothetical protein